MTTIITWNIQWCRGVDGRVDPARIIEHARALADFDVLCLQEVAANFPALAGSAGENQFGISALQRAAQVEAIRARHAEACAHARAGGKRDRSQGPFHGYPRPTSAILTADFNFGPDDPLHARLQAPFDDGAPAFFDAWTHAHPGQPHAHTNGVYDRVQWPEPYACDFIFVTEDLLGRVKTVKVDPDTQASDHQPLLIELS